MKTSKRFGKVSVIHDKVHYFPEDFEFTETGVHAKVAYRTSKWYQDTIKITVNLANEMKEYAETH